MNSRSTEELESQGLEAFREGQIEEALGFLQTAEESYRLAGNAIKAAEMASNLAVIYLQVDRPDESLRALSGVPELFQQHDDQPRLARAFGNMGAALEATGQDAEAEQAYKQAAEVFTQIGDQENLTHTMASLSKLQLRSGNPIDALASMQRGVEGRRSLKDRVLSKLLSLPFRFLRS
jgi:tetratricopeptide (TPR) repeat protein